MIKDNTFIIPIIRSDLIERCLETLYKYTPNNFYVIVVDQSPKGIDMSLRDKYDNLMIIRSPRTDLHYTGNFGHSQGVNIGLQLVQTPYATIMNDDVEFINSKWWQGTIDTFNDVKNATPDRPALLVNVASIRLADWSVGRASGDHFHILPYKEEYTEEDWYFLVNEPHYVNEHLTIQPGSVVDGINLYCSVVDMEKFRKVGFIDEYWYPGNANDYDLCCRASMFGYRCVGTTKAWVFHHWSVSFKDVNEKDEMKALLQTELVKGNLVDKWGSRFDLWGISCSIDGCGKILHTENGVEASCPIHPSEVYAMPEQYISPL